MSVTPSVTPTRPSAIRLSAEKAAMVSLRAGLLGDSNFPVARAPVPVSLWVEGDYLYWTWIDPDSQAKERPRAVDPTGMLDAFLKVNDAAGVLRFARRYGVLMLCEHELPASHNPPLRYQIEGAATGCAPRGWPQPREPIASWLHFARQARSLVRIAAALHQDARPERADWVAIFERWSDVEEKAGILVGNPELARGVLADVVNEWLLLGDVRPQFDWLDDRAGPAFQLAGGTFGILATQLMLAISRRHALAICSGCGAPYLRAGKKPQANRRNYCPTCGERAGNRDRQLTFRSRQHAKQGE